MSGTPSSGPAPDALELAALLCSRVCHDLISPVGAIVNGLEVLDDNPKPEDREFALNLIRKRAKTPSPRLQLLGGGLAKKRVKLLLKMMVIAQQTIPRGGVITVDPIGDGDALSFRVAASGLNARMPQNIADLLASTEGAGVEAHAVQPYYTRLLALSCGLNVVLAPDGDSIVVSAS